jgi:hypothetical protein
MYFSPIIETIAQAQSVLHHAVTLPEQESRIRETPARERDWGSSVEHGGDGVLDQHAGAYSRVQEEASYKSVMVTDKASQLEWIKSSAVCPTQRAQKQRCVTCKSPNSRAHGQIPPPLLPRALSQTLERVCAELGLKLQDPAAEVIAIKIVELAQRGLEKPTELYLGTMAAFKLGNQDTYS